MAAPERIWSGEDSSNDASSEGDENGSADENEVVKPSSQRSVNVKGKQSSQTVIPSSQISIGRVTVESQSSQFSVTTGKGIRKTVIPSSTQTSLKSSQSEGQKSERRSSLEVQSQDSQGRSLGSQFDAPPSSQPRNDSEDEDEEEEESEGDALVEQEDEKFMDVNNVEKSSVGELDDVDIEQEKKPPAEDIAVDKEDKQSTTEETEEDPLDGFDIAPEPKEFQKELLPHASQSKLGLLQKAKNDGQYTGARRLSTFEDEMDFLEYLKSSVQDFAREHPFWAKTDWEDEDKSEFEDDVHEFATAAGMKPYQAHVEVMRALGAWKTERGLPLAVPTKSDCHTELVTDMNLASNAPITKIHDKKRKRVENVAGNVPAPVAAVENDLDEEHERKRQRKEKKKAKRKAEVQQKKLSAVTGTVPKTTVSNQKLNLLSSQDWYSNSAAKESTPPQSKPASFPVAKALSTLEISTPATVKAPVARTPGAGPFAKRRRRKAKQGPVTSDYFPGAAAAIQAQLAEIVAGNAPPADSSTRARVVAKYEPSDALKQMTQAAREAVEKALKTAKNQKKRKRRRNKNKLPADQVGIVATAKKDAIGSEQAEKTEVKTGEPLTKSQRKGRERKDKTKASKLPTPGNTQIIAEAEPLPSESNIADIIEKPGDGTIKNNRRDRGKKAKSQQEDACARIAMDNVSATEPNSHELPTNQGADQDVASKSKDEDIEMAETKPEEPCKKRSRPPRRSKADYLQEQGAPAQQSELEPATATSEHKSSVPEVPKLEPKTADEPDSESMKKKRRQQKQSESKQEDVEMATPDEALTELADTNSEKKPEKKHEKNKKISGKKSVDAMDLNTQPTEESKVSHSTIFEHIPIAFPDILSTSEAQTQPPPLELDHASSEDGSGIGPQIPAPNTAPAGISVVSYTPLKLQIPALASQETLPTSSKADEPLSNNLDDDNGSVWSMKNYGTLDWDHSGDEFEDIQVAPKSTRRRSSASLPESSHPQAQTLLLPPEIPGTFKSFSMIEKDKKAAAVRRDSNGRFVPKKPTHPEQPLRVKRKMPLPSEAETPLPLDVVEDSAPTTRSIKKRKISKKQAPPRPPSASQVSLNRKETRILPPNFVASTQRRYSLEQVQNTPSFPKRDSTGKLFCPKETPIRPPKPTSSSHHGSGSLRNSNGHFPSSKETPIRPPKPVTSGLEGLASASVGDGARLSQQRDSQGKVLSLKGTPIKPSNSAKEVEAGFSETLAQNVTPIFRDKKGRFAPKKEIPIQIPTQPPPAKSSAAANPQPENVHVKNTPQVVIESVGEELKLKPKRAPAKSPYFVPSTPKKAKPSKETGPVTPAFGKRTAGKMLSCIPFPPLSASYFGLIQEKLAHDPFKLLIAVTFLIRTHGKHAIPVFYELMEKYPSPEALIAADKEEGILPIIRHLGLQNQRANTYQTYAKIWLEDPPVKGKRYPVRGYPNPDSGRDASKDEVLTDNDQREAWEIGHMTSGPYAIDSWRIFCRDKLRGLADGWNGEGATQDGFQPEWMRVVPEDKELRAYLRWMWLKEGFAWDPLTGEKEVASERLLRAAMEGRIAWDDGGGMRILDESGGEGEGSANGSVREAG